MLIRDLCNRVLIIHMNGISLITLSKQLSVLCLFLSCLYVYPCGLYFYPKVWDFNLIVIGLKSWQRLGNFSSIPKPCSGGEIRFKCLSSPHYNFVSGEWIHCCKNYSDCSQWWWAHWSYIHYWNCSILDEKSKENRSAGLWLAASTLYQALP